MRRFRFGALSPSITAFFGAPPGGLNTDPVPPQYVCLSAAQLASTSGSLLVSIGNFSAPVQNWTAADGRCSAFRGPGGSLSGGALVAFLLAQLAAQHVDADNAVWSLVVAVPRGEGAGLQVMLNRDGVTSGPQGFTASYAPPVVTSVTVSVGAMVTQRATVGPGGVDVVAATSDAAIVLAGANFGVCPVVVVGSPGANASFTWTVDFCAAGGGGGGSAHTSEALSFAVPSGEGSGLAYPPFAPWRIVVFVAGQNSSSSVLRFSYAAPTLLSVTSAGPTVGGTTLTLQGINFGVAALPLSAPVQVALSDESGANWRPCPGATRVAPHTTVQCVLPPGAGAGLSVRLNVSGLTATAAGNFSYFPPAVSALVPSPAAVARGQARYVGQALEGLSGGGYNVTILGANFGAAPALVDRCALLGWPYAAAPARPVCNGFEDFVGEGEVWAGYVWSWNDTAILLTVPHGTSTRVVSVSVRGQLAVTTYPFVYAAPTLASLAAGGGATDGGDVVTVCGASLGSSSAGVNWLLPQQLPLARIAPTSYLLVNFFQTCISVARTPAGAVPGVVAACVPSVVSHNDSCVVVRSPPGIDVGRRVSVVLADAGGGPTLFSPAVLFNYSAPVATYANPNLVCVRRRHRRRRRRHRHNRRAPPAAAAAAAAVARGSHRVAARPRVSQVPRRLRHRQPRGGFGRKPRLRGPCCARGVDARRESRLRGPGPQRRLRVRARAMRGCAVLCGRPIRRMHFLCGRPVRRAETRVRHVTGSQVPAGGRGGGRAPDRVLGHARHRRARERVGARGWSTGAPARRAARHGGGGAVGDS